MQGCARGDDGTWVHTITGRYKGDGRLVAAHFHCHAPACLSMAMYKCPSNISVADCNETTAELLCGRFRPKLRFTAHLSTTHPYPIPSSFLPHSSLIAPPPPPLPPRQRKSPSTATATECASKSQVSSSSHRVSGAPRSMASNHRSTSQAQRSSPRRRQMQRTRITEKWPGSRCTFKNELCRLYCPWPWPCLPPCPPPALPLPRVIWLCP